MEIRSLRLRIEGQGLGGPTGGFGVQGFRV